MKSSDLPERGFGTWLPFTRVGESALLSTLPEKFGVYVLRCNRCECPRRVGASDILYIGSATNKQGLQLRLRQYFHHGPTQWTNIRILARLDDCQLVGTARGRSLCRRAADLPTSGGSDFAVTFMVTKSIPDAKMLEAALLEAYEIDHGELPPENLRR